MKVFSFDEFLSMQLSNLKNTTDKTPNSFSYDIVSAASIVDVELQRRIYEIYQKLNVDNLVGMELERRVFQMAGVIRKDATRSYGKLKIKGIVGTLIPAQTVFLSDDGKKYITFYDYTIGDSGEIDIYVYSYDYGSETNTEAHTINKVEKYINGLSSVDNLFPISGGYDVENDGDLRERYYWKIQNPPKAGNPDHYKLWAEEVEGIGYAKVFRTWQGPSTVKVVVIGSDHKAVSGDMIEKVKNHIMKEAPIHWEKLTVKSASETNIDIKAKLDLKGGYVIDEVKSNIKDNIEIYLAEIAFKKSFVSYAKIAQAIMDTEGVADFDDLRINSTYDNIELEDEQVGVVGKIEVTTDV